VAGGLNDSLPLPCRELMQSKDALDKEIQLSKSVLPVHPRLLEELQAEHAWLKQRV